MHLEIILVSVVIGVAACLGDEKNVANSCRKVNRGKGYFFGKTNILKDIIIHTRTKLKAISSRKDEFSSSRHSRKNRTCVTQKRLLQAIIVDFQSDEILPLPNLVVENINTRFVNRYCFVRAKDKTTLPRLIVLLGILKYYTPDKYMTLSNVRFSLERNRDIIAMKAIGVYNLCGTRFLYRISPENKNIAVMHAVSDERITMENIEMSHPLNEFPLKKYGIVESILTNKFKVITTLFIKDPIWSVVWTGGNRLSAFKGPGSVQFDNKLKDIHLELMIDADIKFWLMRLSLRLSIFEIMNITKHAFPLWKAIPLLKDGWEQQVEVSEVEVVTATDQVIIPATKYLLQNYMLAKYYVDGKIQHGFSLNFKGTTRKLPNKKSKIPLVNGETKFEAMIDILDNSVTQFEINFKHPSLCPTNNEGRQEWREIKKMFHIQKALSKNQNSRVATEMSKCLYCCNTNSETLVSLKGRFYQESVKSKYAKYGIEPEIHYFYDLDTYVSTKEELRNYRLRRVPLQIMK